ncbi:MAG: hypothetical protein HRT45_14445 [Bdellovibrionales bacterium]|nr:hypothetical protein [Bdellovibrionales bacterium]
MSYRLELKSYIAKAVVVLATLLLPLASFANEKYDSAVENYIGEAPLENVVAGWRGGYRVRAMELYESDTELGVKLRAAMSILKGCGYMIVEYNVVDLDYQYRNRGYNRKVGVIHGKEFYSDNDPAVQPGDVVGSGAWWNAKLVVMQGATELSTDEPAQGADQFFGEMRPLLSDPERSARFTSFHFAVFALSFLERNGYVYDSEERVYLEPENALEGCQVHQGS